MSISTPGFEVGILGIVLVSVFARRMVLGLSTLPLSFSASSAEAEEDGGRWKRIQRLIWIFIGPLMSLVSLPVIFAFMVPQLDVRLLQSQNDPWLAAWWNCLTAMVMIAIAIGIVGWDGFIQLRRFVRPCEIQYAMLAAAISVGIPVLISIGHYLLDRAGRTSDEFGIYVSPQFGSYFNSPNAWLYFMFFGALAEEIVFRGFVQSAFIARYDIYRGIFLTGIVWAAYHFSSDAYVHPSQSQALTQLAFRIFMCVSQGFVLSWLTLRSGSVLPGAIAHTLYNVFVSDFGPQFYGKATLQVAMWAVMAYFLFRYWPVQMAIEPYPDTPTIEPDLQD